MADVPLPGFGTELDSRDSISKNASTLGLASVGVTLALGAVAVGVWLWNQLTASAGVGNQVDIPVV